MNHITQHLKKKGTWAGLMLVIVAAVTLEATSLVQFYFSKQGIKEEATARAQSQLETSRSQIMDIVNQTEAAVRNSVWIAQWCLDAFLGIRAPIFTCNYR